MLKGIQQHCQNILQQLPANRLLAIDVLRGLTITAMILVNNPGSWSYIYAPLKHADWHGWTPTDLIFPFFIFIVGLSVNIAIGRQVQAGKSHRQILTMAAVRMLKLLLLGWFLALFYYNIVAVDYSWVDQRLLQIRVMGVLQRIGLVYMATVVIVLYWRTMGRCLWLLALLLGYWLIMTQVPYTDMAGNHYQGHLEFGNNLSAWLDSLIFASKHLYYSAAQPFAFDPEGLLSTLPAIATCLSGVLLGQWLFEHKGSLERKVLWLISGGIVAVLVAELWGQFFPINKALWTSSYVLLSSGYACIALGLCLWLLDIKGIKNWSAPFLVFGANSIAFFMFAGVLGRLLIMIPVADTSVKGWFYSSILQPVLGNYNGSLAFAVLFLLLSYAVMFHMYKKGIFWKV